MIAACQMPGPGDEATWGECRGHPHDPRTPDDDQDDLISYCRGKLEIADIAVGEGDLAVARKSLAEVLYVLECL